MKLVDYSTTSEKKCFYFKLITQLVNHERLNLLGLYIASHITHGSWYKRTEKKNYITDHNENIFIISSTIVKIKHPTAFK
jgi:hypothetical protein